MEPLYRVILKKGWEITRKYKFLWIFGIFALWLGNGGEIQIFFRTLYFIRDTTSTSFFRALVNNFFFLNFFKNAVGFNAIIVGILFTLISLVILLIIVWIIIISQTAIINATHSIFKKKNKISFKSVFQSSQPYFLPVLGLNLVSRVLIGGLVFLLLLPILIIVLNTGSKFTMLLSILIWVIFLPIAAIISFIMKYAINFVIIKKEKFWSSISKAWYLFKTNWLISIEMTLALLIINFLVGIVVIFITIVILGPYSSIDLLTIYAFKNLALGLIVFKLLPLCLIYLIAGSGIAVFQTVSWTLLFEKITTGKRYSKLIRIIADLSNYMRSKHQISKVSDINRITTPKLKRRRGRPKVRKK